MDTMKTSHLYLFSLLEIKGIVVLSCRHAFNHSFLIMHKNAQLLTLYFFLLLKLPNSARVKILGFLSEFQLLNCEIT